MFLDAIVDSVRKNNMQDGLSIEVWNEPDGNYFWLRSQEQYFEMWGRGLPRLRYVQQLPAQITTDDQKKST